MIQIAKALLYYAFVLGVFRVSGKRLAGQTTTFDLIVLITLGVVLQMNLLEPGLENGLIFVATVLVTHKALALGMARSRALRYFIRGAPRVLVENGEVLWPALRAEGMSQEELLAGLRKLGHDSPAKLKRAVLEETGHISAVE